MRLSYSGLDTYQTCPLKYKYGHVDHLKEPKTPEQVFGTVIHSTLQFIHSPKLIPPTLEEAITYFTTNWNSDIYENELEERAAFSQGVKMIQDYYKKNDPRDFTIVDLESRFQLELGTEATGTHIIAGIIDRIDKTEEGYEIIDYKTGKKMPSQDKVDQDLQLSIYLRAFLDRYPKERDNIANITVSLYFLKHGVKLSSTRTVEQLQKLDTHVLDIISHIEAEEFEPRLNPLCNWCGYQKICPLWKHKYAEERRVETDEVRQAIADYIALKNDIAGKKLRLATLQDMVLRYMEQEGVERVFGDAGVIGKSVRKIYKYDEAFVKRILEPLGEWESVRKLDLILLRKKLGEIPLLARQSIEHDGRVVDKETIALSVKKGNFLEHEDTLIGEGEVIE